SPAPTTPPWCPRTARPTTAWLRPRRSPSRDALIRGGTRRSTQRSPGPGGTRAAARPLCFRASLVRFALSVRARFSCAGLSAGALVQSLDWQSRIERRQGAAAPCDPSWGFAPFPLGPRRAPFWGGFSALCRGLPPQKRLARDQTDGTGDVYRPYAQVCVTRS